MVHRAYELTGRKKTTYQLIKTINIQTLMKKKRVEKAILNSVRAYQTLEGNKLSSISSLQGFKISQVINLETSINSQL